MAYFLVLTYGNFIWDFILLLVFWSCINLKVFKMIYILCILYIIKLCSKNMYRLIQKSAEALEEVFYLDQFAIYLRSCFLFTHLCEFLVFLSFHVSQTSSLIKTCMLEDFIAHGYNCYVSVIIRKVKVRL